MAAMDAKVIVSDSCLRLLLFAGMPVSRHLRPVRMIENEYGDRDLTMLFQF